MDIQEIRVANLQGLIDSGKYGKNRKEFADNLPITYPSFCAWMNPNNPAAISTDRAREIEKVLELPFQSLDEPTKHLPVETPPEKKKEIKTKPSVVSFEAEGFSMKLSIDSDKRPKDEKVLALALKIIELRS